MLASGDEVTPDELGATTRYLPLTAGKSNYFNDQTPRWAASSNQASSRQLL